MRIEKIDPTEVNLADYNPREISPYAFKGLIESIRTFGFQQPIIINKRTNILISGNQRTKAAIELGLKDIPVVYVDLSEVEEKAFNITMNNKAIEGEFTEDLKILLAEIKESLGDDFIFDLNMDELLKDIKDDFTSVLNEEDEEDEEDEEEIPLTKDNKKEKVEIKEEHLPKFTKALSRLAGRWLRDLNKFFNGEIESVHSDISIEMATVNFIRCKYQGKHYQRNNALAFAPQMLLTCGKNVKKNLQELLSEVQEYKETSMKAMLFLNEYENVALKTILSSSIPRGGWKAVLDFPAEMAKEIYEECTRSKNEIKIIDPCHGWGGRAIGFLLSNLTNSSYTGIDPSTYAHSALNKIKENFMPIVKDEGKEITLIKACFEDVKLEPCSFDIALTSPPYFDVELYEGKETSSSKFNNYNLWRDGFYTKLITNIYLALKNNSYFILQVGSQRYPLKNDAIAIGKRVGFSVKRIEHTGMALHQKDKDDDGEVLIYLYKDKR